MAEININWNNKWYIKTRTVIQLSVSSLGFSVISTITELKYHSVLLTLHGNNPLLSAGTVLEMRKPTPSSKPTPTLNNWVLCDSCSDDGVGYDALQSKVSLSQGNLRRKHELLGYFKLATLESTETIRLTVKFKGETSHFSVLTWI